MEYFNIQIKKTNTLGFPLKLNVNTYSPFRVSDCLTRNIP